MPTLFPSGEEGGVFTCSLNDFDLPSRLLQERGGVESAPGGSNSCESSLVPRKKIILIRLVFNADPIRLYRLFTSISFTCSPGCNIQSRAERFPLTITTNYTLIFYVCSCYTSLFIWEDCLHHFHVVRAGSKRHR
jgi:hypothetical protein